MSETTENRGPEYYTANYEEPHVRRSLDGAGWFTPEHIQKINEELPRTKYSLMNGYEDSDLAAFVDTQFDGDGHPKKTFFREVCNGVDSLLFTSGGNSLSLSELNFVDDEVMRLAHRLGVDESFKPNRNAYNIGGVISALVAPEENMKNRIIRHICALPDEKNDRYKEVLIGSLLIKKAAQHYLEETNT